MPEHVQTTGLHLGSRPDSAPFVPQERGFSRRCQICWAPTAGQHCDEEDTSSVPFADEPTTALDVTIQAQILDLMLQLNKEMGTAIILITHNFGIVAEIARRVMVMYAGQIVEEAGVKEIFKNPLHPYTQGLLKSMPRLDKKATKGSRLEEISGSVPGLHNLPQGCIFFPRCQHRTNKCRKEPPQLISLPEQRSIRCWLYSN